MCLYIKIKLLTLGPFDGKWFSHVFSFPFVKIYLLTCGFFTSKLNCLNLDESKLFIKFTCLTISEKSANELFIERVVSFLPFFLSLPSYNPQRKWQMWIAEMKWNILAYVTALCWIKLDLLQYVSLSCPLVVWAEDNNEDTGKICMKDQVIISLLLNNIIQPQTWFNNNYNLGSKTSP